jgi:hypothetical protein
MALITTLKPLRKDRCSPHGEVECTFTIFTDDAGKKYLQLDTYGSASRQLTGKVSQSVQFNAESLRQLKALLASEFPALS